MFGAYRRDLLAGSLGQMDADAQRQREVRAGSLRKAIAETETRSERLLRNLQFVDNPDQSFIQHLSERWAKLRGRQVDLEQQSAGLEAEIQETPNLDPLTALPVTSVGVTGNAGRHVPPPPRGTPVGDPYDHRTELATCRVTLTDGGTSPIWQDSLPGRSGGTTLRMSAEEGIAGTETPPSFCVAPPAGHRQHLYGPVAAVSWCFPARSWCRTYVGAVVGVVPGDRPERNAAR
ncbi:hypothetical protein OIE52_19500 [Streptomyces canus]|uniref:hypothetical protein n=1 Tax=Streptomyces canus TaxID=58343 RepID=UPI0030E12264